MKPVREFVAERLAVQHCAELLRSSQAEFDLAAASADLVSELALVLPARLEALLLGPRIMVSDWPVEGSTAGALAASWSAPSIHYMITLAPGLPRFVVSFDNALALALTDRLFGGAGDVPNDVPKALPQSAALAVERLVRSLAAALGPLCGISGDDTAIARHAVFHRLGAFKRNTRCLHWSMTIEQQDSDPWNLSVAVDEEGLRALLEQRAAGGPAKSASYSPDPHAAAFGTIPLALSAIVAELHLPLARLAELKPGSTIPFAPRREVPLLVGGQIFATGTVGTLDERVALRLGRIS
ncbi:MAG: FliM/FliN family flagellar motor switch protein [Sphingomonadaceae bacterium]|nr:FliM/FliN family flagellar motor switch protein [Sphingomonadaceae bacterium]